jgi:long-subunit fatty acid transport protein
MKSLRCGAKLALVGLASLLALPSPIEAQGYELTTAGARANARAGANHVGGDSAMSLFYNPANIGRDGARYGVAGALHMHFTNRCMTRVGVVETNGDREAGDTFPEVCGEGPPAVLPQVAFTMRLTDGLTLGAGIYVPPAAVRRVRFGDPEAVTFDPNGDAIPTPTRYLLVEQQLLQLFPTVGLGYEVNPRFRIGATFGWGITKIDFTSTAYSRTEVDVIGFDLATAHTDARNRLQATDGFVPRLNLGIWGQPSEDLPLELGLSYLWTGNVRTNDASLQVDTVRTDIEPAWIGAIVGDIEGSGRIDDVRLRVPQTSQLAFGLRYAEKLATPVGELQDRLSTERFDVELNVVLTFGRRVRQYNVELPEGSALVVPVPIVGDTEVPLPEEINLDQRWRTQVALRLGGDYAIIPGTFAVRGGLSYVSNGVQGGYQQLNFQPFRQVGLHMGGTYRVAGFLDLSVAYAHIFQPDVNVSPQQANLRRTVGGDADPENPQDAEIVNAGRFTGRHHVLIVEAGARF